MRPPGAGRGSTDLRTGEPPVLTDAQVAAFARDIEALGQEVMRTRGARDRAYILRIISWQRSLDAVGRLVICSSAALLPAWGHALAGWWGVVAVAGLGAIVLGIAKILENMEISHNVLHGQWDWMQDPGIRSTTWEWDCVAPASSWRRSHNGVHHQWTNVLGKDMDLGFGIMRVTPMQPWRPVNLLQPVFLVVHMLLFEWGVAFHERPVHDALRGRISWTGLAPCLRRIGAKALRPVLKDYVLWPGAAALACLLLPWQPLAPWLVFLVVAAANAAACLIRNAWACAIIYCGHFPSGVDVFTADQVAGESRGRWYVRQLLGSCNIEGGRLFHLLTGHLSHQIEHHLYPTMCSNRYPEVAPRIRELAARHGLPYRTGSLLRQFGSAWLNNLRLALPGGSVAGRP